MMDAEDSNNYTWVVNRLGGLRGVRRLVNAFYDNVLANEILSPFFVGVKMHDLAQHQEDFIISGLCKLKHNVNLRASHRKLVDEMGLDDSHFDEMKKVVRESLTQSGVLDDDIYRMLDQYLESSRAEILNK